MHRIVLLVLWALTSHAPSVSAEIVTFNFSGTVDAETSSVLDGIIGIGDPVSVRVDVESTAPDGSPDQNIGEYTGGVTALSFQLGAYSGSAILPVRFTVGSDFSDGRDFVEVVSRNIDAPAIDSEREFAGCKSCRW